MKKDFRKWHGKKSYIDEVPQRPFFHKREIWYCSIGLNVGVEQNGGGEDFLRPVVILRKFNNESFWAIPLTRTEKRDQVHYVTFSFVKGIESTANLSQLRLIDARRLNYMIGVIDEDSFREIKKRLKNFLS